MSRRLLLIDGHSVAYRAFFGLPPENFSANGQYTNAVYGFTSMLINLLREESPTHVGVAFDVSRHTFRTDEYPEYKATRSASPAEFKGQIALIKKVLDALRITHVELPGFEADDIVGTLSAKALAEGYEEILICSGDRDSLQFVDDKVTLLYPKKGVSELARMTPAAVEEKYAVSPQRYPELAALVGETSDNLPGVPGVGPKTAAKWLASYDGLENLLARADEVPGKAGESLRQHLEDVQRNRRLNALLRNLELPVLVTQLERQSWDQEAVAEVFGELEFKTLHKRLMETLPLTEDLIAAPEMASFTCETTVLKADELTVWLATQTKSQPVGFVIKGTWSQGQVTFQGIALAGSTGQAAWLSSSNLSSSDTAELATWLTDEQISKVMHDAKGQLHIARHCGWNVRGMSCDTQLAAYLLRPDQRSYNLGDLVLRYLNQELQLTPADNTEKAEIQEAFDFADPDTSEDDADATAAMIEAAAIAQLATALENELANTEQLSLLQDVELPLQNVLARMESVGIAIDQEFLTQLRNEFDIEVTNAADAAYAAIGKKINLSSPKQLQVVLFDELGLPKTRKTASGGYTTDAEALAWLFEQSSHTFVKHVLEHRDWIKLRQTVDGLLAAVGVDGRIHTTYLQTVAGTGRLSSTEPNLQNIPIRTEAGRRIRQAFVVGDNYKTLLTADYSQIEMRIMAAQSGDRELIEAFLSGRDFHTETAARVFSVALDAVTPEMRARIKAMNYGLAYGLSPYGLSNQLGIEVSQAKTMMEEYFASFGGAKRYLDGLVVKARETGYTTTMLGRRRYLPDLTSSNRQRREIAERAALNAPIQGSAADVMKVAMLKVDKALRSGGFISRVLLQVHDELVVEVADGEQDAVVALLREQMAAAAQLAVPLDVSVGCGQSWFEAAH
ncbi:MAG: DNA polymerase I [Propionibacteriaceae bacterium]